MTTCGGEAAKVRNLRKKLAQIVLLEERRALGGELSSEQLSKLARKAALQLELGQLVDTVDVGDSSVTTAASEAPAFTASEADSSPPTPAEGAAMEDLAPELGEAPEAARPRLHSNRWEEDPIAVEDVAPAHDGTQPADSEAVILEAVQPFAPASRSDQYLQRLVRATSDLSNEAFGSDVLEGVSRKGKWKLTLLALPRESVTSADPWGGLLGFIAYKLKPHVQSVSIAKLAVVPEQRGKGHGHKLVQWCIAMAKKQPNMVYLSLTSLPQAIRFYKQIGFRQVDVDLSKLDPIAEEDDCDYVEGQVYMEYRCRGRGPARRRR